jgi:hypothetical protein
MVSLLKSLTFTAAIALSSLVVLIAADTWGPSWSLGPTKSRIIEVTTTLEPGAPPQPPHTMLALWPGISNGSGDLIQSTVEQWDDNAWCGATKEEWCVRASLFGSFGQKDGKAAKVGAHEKITFHYKRSADAKSWTQTVTRHATGEVVSTLTSNSGHMTGFGTGTECNDKCTGTTSIQYYTDTTIVLEEADPTFGNTKAIAKGAHEEGFTSSQGGKVWTVKKITLPAMK